MNESVSDKTPHELMRKATEVAIRLFLLAGVVLWCFLIFQPFLMPVVWGIVIAVALSPAYFWLESLLGGRSKLAGTLFILLGVGLLAVPVFLVSESALEGVQWLKAQQDKDAIHVPPPPSGVADWPLIGDSVHEVRKRLGRRLAQEQPAQADIVIPVPDSGTVAALGYAEGSGIPFDYGFIRSHYVGRTFIMPEAGERATKVDMKLAPVSEVVKGKRVATSVYLVAGSALNFGIPARSQTLSAYRRTSDAAGCRGAELLSWPAQYSSASASWF